LEGLLEIVILKMTTKCQGWYMFEELEGERQRFYELQRWSCQVKCKQT